MGSSGNLVLVTGANGFIGTQTVASLLESGYRVRGAVRSQSSADAILKTFPENLDKLSVVVIPDMTAQSAFDEAVEVSMEYVNPAMQYHFQSQCSTLATYGFYTASPFKLNIKDNEAEMLVPAIKGTEVLLESVAMHGSDAKRVVFTSSFAAMADFTKGF
ncbi:hypothetical protein ACJZ2D_014682 [Fusarium nematophilum]